MAMIGRKPYNPNAYVPPYQGTPSPVSLDTTPFTPTTTLSSLAPMPTVAAPQSKHNWIGILADALSGLAGQGPVYAPLAARRQDEQTAFERGEQTYQAHRAQDLKDQMTLLDYKRAHPDDALSQALDQAGVTDPAERQKYYKADVERMTAPPMMSAQGVDEQGNPVMRFFPRAQPVAPSTMPAPTVGTIKNGYRFKGGNPASPDAWEPAGGAGSGPRTFP